MNNSSVPSENSKNTSTVDNHRSKKDVIVSVRLPKGMLDELKDLQQINHFMDLSDEIRFIVRKYCFSFLSSKISDSDSSIEQKLIEQKKREQAILELEKVMQTLKGQNAVNSNNQKQS